MGFQANAYHAGMETKLRNVAQERFMKVENIVVSILNSLWLFLPD